MSIPGDASVEGEAPQLVLEVEDDGKGMDPRQLERTTDGSFTTKPQGSGLKDRDGLATVSQVE